jgi:predicted MFS family arabinose efflux permease
MKLLSIYKEAFSNLQRNVWILSIAMFINRSGSMVLLFTSLYLTRDLHFSLAEAGAVLSCYGIGSVCGSYLGGWLTDRKNYFDIMISSLLLSGAILLSLSPKFGAVLSATPAGVLGGVGVALYGLIGVLGAKIWIENKVDFGNSTNLFIAATTLIIGIADMTWKRGDYSFGGIINGTLVAVIGYQVLRALNKAAGKAK